MTGWPEWPVWPKEAMIDTDTINNKEIWKKLNSILKRIKDDTDKNAILAEIKADLEKKEGDMEKKYNQYLIALKGATKIDVSPETNNNLKESIDKINDAAKIAIENWEWMDWFVTKQKKLLKNTKITDDTTVKEIQWYLLNNWYYKQAWVDTTSGVGIDWDFWKWSGLALTEYLKTVFVMKIIETYTTSKRSIQWQWYNRPTANEMSFSKGANGGFESLRAAIKGGDFPYKTIGEITKRLKNKPSGMENNLEKEKEDYFLAQVATRLPKFKNPEKYKEEITNTATNIINGESVTVEVPEIKLDESVYIMATKLRKEDGKITGDSNPLSFVREWQNSDESPGGALYENQVQILKDISHYIKTATIKDINKEITTQIQETNIREWASMNFLIDKKYCKESSTKGMVIRKGQETPKDQVEQIAKKIFTKNRIIDKVSTYPAKVPTLQIPETKIFITETKKVDKKVWFKK